MTRQICDAIGWLSLDRGDQSQTEADPLRGNLRQCWPPTRLVSIIIVNFFFPGDNASRDIYFEIRRM